MTLITQIIRLTRCYQTIDGMIVSRCYIYSVKFKAALFRSIEPCILVDLQKVFA